MKQKPSLKPAELSPEEKLYLTGTFRDSLLKRCLDIADFEGLKGALFNVRSHRILTQNSYERNRLTQHDYDVEMEAYEYVEHELIRMLEPQKQG